MLQQRYNTLKSGHQEKETGHVSWDGERLHHAERHGDGNGIRNLKNVIGKQQQRALFFHLQIYAQSHGKDIRNTHTHTHTLKIIIIKKN